MMMVVIPRAESPSEKRSRQLDFFQENGNRENGKKENDPHREKMNFSAKVAFCWGRR